MAVLLLASFMNLIDVTIVNVALPGLQRAFDATSSAIEWVVAAYILVFALLLLPAGRLGDIFGRRRMFIAGVVVFTIGSALCGFAPSIGTLVAARVLQAVGGAMMTPQTLAIVPTIFPPQERGAAFALFGLSAGLASVSGPVLGGFLIGQDIMGLGWRPIFLINLPIGVFAIVMALRFVPSVPGTRGLRNDYVGIVLAGSALLLVIFPLIEGRQAGWPAWCFAMMAAALPMTWAFVWWQRQQARRDAPQLLPVSLLSDRAFLVGTAMVAVLFSGIPGFFLVMALYLQNGYELSALQSGLTTVPFSLGVLVASVASGRLGNRWQRPRIVVGAALLGIAMVWLRFTVLQTGDAIQWRAFALPLLLGGIGLGTTLSPLFQTVLSHISARDTGSASGALQAFQQVGAAFGVAIMGELFFSRLGSASAALARGVTSAADRLAAQHAAFADAITHAVVYNSVAFFLICGAVLLFRQRAQVAGGGLAGAAPAGAQPPGHH